jgi:hypothetical protein
VIECFDDNCREISVMDIVGRYDRPQSGTSDLLPSSASSTMTVMDAPTV